MKTRRMASSAAAAVEDTVEVAEEAVEERQDEGVDTVTAIESEAPMMKYVLHHVDR